MKKKISALLVALLCMYSGMLQSQTFRYVRAGFAGPGTDPFNPSGDLQATINASANGDFIFVTAGAYQPAAGQSFIMKEGVKIYGGYSLDFFSRNFITNVSILQANFNRVIRNESNGLTNAALLDGFTISGGSAWEGGGMYNFGSSPSVVNCTFTDNYASLGGAMFNQNASPRIIGCKFISNRADERGGAITNRSSIPTITACEITSNRARSGGGMFNELSSPVILGTRFTSNRATDAIFGGGGGGMCNSMGSQPTITSCEFNRDTAFLWGGGILNQTGSKPIISNTTFLLNNANSGGGICNHGTSPVITSSTFTFNLAVNGGAMYNDNTLTFVASCTFAGNRATNGAAIYHINEDLPIIASSRFTGNWASLNGGGFYINALSGPSFRGCTIAGNSAVNGGAFYLDNGRTGILNSIIWGNSSNFFNNASSVSVSTSIIQGGHIGFSNLDVDPQFINPVSHTFAPFTGGDYRVQRCSPAYNSANRFDIPVGNTTDVAGNPRIIGAATDRGAYEYAAVIAGPDNIIYVNQNSPNSSGNGSSWANAHTNLSEALLYAKVQGGVNPVFTTPLKIFVAKGTYKPSFHIDNPCLDDRDNSFTLLDEVQVYGGFDPAAGIDDLNDTRITGSGGSILSGDVGVANNNTDNCYHVVSSSTNSPNTRLDAVTVTGGNASGVNTYGFGGGIFSTAAMLKVNNCIITGNSAWGGGGMFNENGMPEITGCTFSNNVVLGYGGAVYNSGNQGAFADCSFTGNVAINPTGGGGAIANNTASPGIVRCYFSSNTGDYGGAIYNFGFSFPVFNDCRFNGNSAYMFGGAIYNTETSSPNIYKSVFTGNNTHFGGAIFNMGAATVTYCSFSGNSANSYGGAVYNNGAAANASYESCVFSGNNIINAGGGGAAIFNNASQPFITNCTFRSNSSTFGGAIHNWSTAFSTVRNSIIWGNSSGIYNESGAGASVSYSDVQGGYAGTGNLNIDPLFANSALPAGTDGNWGTTDDGLRLQSCSPLINMGGIFPQLANDILITPRVQFNAVDMGAYETNSITDIASANLITTNTVATAWQLPNAQTFYGINCNTLVASITGNGSAASISGNTTVKTWIDVLQSPGYVKRHYEIEPHDVNPATATATVTLYYTQAEFDAFNAINSIKLPQGPSDVAGIARLLVEKRGGISNNSSGLPESYAGSISTINPDDAAIIWNAARQRWEVSFPVTGFSGFFVKTQAFTLPLKLVSFTAEEKNCITTLKWITKDEVNVSHFEVEQSADGTTFQKIETIAARNSGAENIYTTVVPVQQQQIFYRLKMVDVDGVTTYSAVIHISSMCGNKLSVYPNPAKAKVYIRNATIGSRYTIYNNMGQQVRSGRVSNAVQEIFIADLTNGIYYINIIDAHGTNSKTSLLKE